MKRTGFTLIELSAVVGIVTLVTATLAPGIKSTRMKAQARGSESNLMQIGQGSDMYGMDHAGRIFSYTWRAGVAYTLPEGKTRTYATDAIAASGQNEEILERLTGRISGEYAIKNYVGRLPHRRLRHLVLVDYLHLEPTDPRFADPADANQFLWQANPLDIGAGSGVPYAPESDTVGYDQEGIEGWEVTAVRQRWPFSTSYEGTVAAWQGDGLNGWQSLHIPIQSTPNLFQAGGDPQLADGRNLLEVVFPGAKVHLFEEFDREQAGSPYFGYDHARPAKLMFDGSVNEWASGAARPSWNPADNKVEWRQAFIPLHTYPFPLEGPGSNPILSQRYRWTLGGLKGVDYPQPLMGR